MKNEIIVSNKETMSDVTEMCAKMADTTSVIESLSSMSNATANALIEEKKLLLNYQLGFILGGLKANLDTLPEEISSKEKISGVPLDLLIKMKVDENVLDIRERNNAKTFTGETEYHKRYRRLSELICGFGYNMSFIQDRFEEFFPEGSHQFVLGFAEGYSITFKNIAKAEGIEVDQTDPKNQDIWKNWPYFLDRKCHEYNLSGVYLFMYHGGANWTRNSEIPYGNNQREVNKGVYEKLKARDTSKFTSGTFEF